MDYNPKRKFLIRFRKVRLFYFIIKLNTYTGSVSDSPSNGD